MAKRNVNAIFNELLELIEDVPPKDAIDGLANALSRVLQSGTVQDQFGDDLLPCLELVDELQRLSERLDQADEFDGS